MRRRRSILFSAVFLMLPLGLTAQEITDYSFLESNGVTSRPLAAQEYLQFLGGSGVGSPWGAQVGPYTARFTGPTSATFSIVCVDYSNYATSEWMNVTSLAAGGATDLSNTRAGTGSFAKYQQSSYLASLFDSWQDYESEEYDTGTFSSRADVFAGIHAAIWRVMTAGTSNAFPFNSSSPGVPGSKQQLAYDMGQFFIDKANQFAGAFSTDGWYVLSPDDIAGLTGDDRLRAGGQEFLIRAQTQVVPEPSTWILLGSGLFLILAFHRRRQLKGREA